MEIIFQKSCARQNAEYRAEIIFEYVCGSQIYINMYHNIDLDLEIQGQVRFIVT